MSPKSEVERRVKAIKRNTRKQYSAEEKIRIILEGLRGEDSIAGLCRKESIAHLTWNDSSRMFLITIGLISLHCIVVCQIRSNKVDIY